MFVVPGARAAVDNSSHDVSRKQAVPVSVEANPSSAQQSPPSSEVVPKVIASIQASGSKDWPHFLKEFSPFILTCLRRYAGNEDERMDIYVHVCDRLAADDCRRLRQYRGRGSRGTCRFTTWLAAVVFNLAREWIRSSRGRRRLFRSVRDLNRTDRLVFKYYFWEGYSAGQIAQVLRSRGHKGCDAAEIGHRLASIERQLSRDHRWRLVTSLLRSAGPVSIDRPHFVVGDSPTFEVSDERQEGVEKLARMEALELLIRLIEQLPDEERVAIKLRFNRAMTAREISVVLGIRNYKRVYEIQGRALSTLAEGLKKRGFELSDFLDRRTNSIQRAP